MKPDRLGGFMCYLTITMFLFLIGFGLYQFINNPIGKIVFAIYSIFAFMIDILAGIFFTDDDNLM